MEDSKFLYDVQFKKYKDDNRFRYTNGNSCMKKLWINNDINITVYRPENTEVTEIDQIHNINLEKYHIHFNEDKMMKIVEDLEKYNVGKSISHKRERELDIITYKVPIIGYINKKDKDIYDKFAWYGPFSVTVKDNTTHYKLKLIGRHNAFFPSEVEEKAPGSEEIFGYKLYAPKGSLSDDRSTRDATCRNMNIYSYYSSENPEQVLETDFGREVDLTAISVSAKLCETYKFPDYKWQNYIRRNRFEKESLENVFINGKKFDELNSNKIIYYEIIKNPEDVSEHRFYIKYEIFYRKEKGKWVSIGFFSGPENNFQEKVHLLRDSQIVNDTLKCRYIRIKPSYCSNFHKRGMKVAFFGHSDQIQENKNGCSNEQVIKYTVEKLKDTYNNKIQPKSRDSGDNKINLKGHKNKIKNELKNEIQYEKNLL